MQKTKKLPSPTIIFLVGNIILFFLAHTYFLTESEAVLSIHYYLMKLWVMIFPPLAAIFTLAGRERNGIRALLLCPLTLSLTKAIYYLPYYYELYVLEENFVSTDALIMSSLITALDLLLSYVHVLVYSLIAYVAVKLFSRDVSGSEEGAVSPYDLSHPITTSSVTLAILGLVYTATSELLFTIPFLDTYILTIRTDEILTMIFDYLLMIVIHVAIYFLSVKFSLPRYYQREKSDCGVAGDTDTQ